MNIKGGWHHLDQAVKWIEEAESLMTGGVGDDPDPQAAMAAARIAEIHLKLSDAMGR